MPNARVEIYGTKELRDKLNFMFGPVEGPKRARKALVTAAKEVLVPAVRSETPPSNRTSPWRGRRTPYENTQTRYPGPMVDRAYVKEGRRRTYESGVVIVNIKHYAKAVVVRGGVAHEQPRNRRFPYHPGSRSRDIFGVARRRAEKPFVLRVKQELWRQMNG